jgi:hypothetical protein
MRRRSVFTTSARVAWPTARTAVFAVWALAAPISVAAQSAPPVQGTIALEGTMKKFYRGANVVIVTTIDGVEHVYRFAKDLVVHGGKGSGVKALEDLREGALVVVHYTAEGNEQAVQEVDVIGSEGLEVTEGLVDRIDRGRGQITVRYFDGKTEVFRLTDRAAAATQSVDQAGPTGTIVRIYYSDERGQRVVHHFRMVSK